MLKSLKLALFLTPSLCCASVHMHFDQSGCSLTLLPSYEEAVQTFISESSENKEKARYVLHEKFTNSDEKSEESASLLWRFGSEADRAEIREVASTALLADFLQQTHIVAVASLLKYGTEEEKDASSDILWKVASNRWNHEYQYALRMLVQYGSRTDKQKLYDVAQSLYQEQNREAACSARDYGNDSVYPDSDNDEQDSSLPSYMTAIAPFTVLLNLFEFGNEQDKAMTYDALSQIARNPHSDKSEEALHMLWKFGSQEDKEAYRVYGKKLFHEADFCQWIAQKTFSIAEQFWKSADVADKAIGNQLLLKIIHAVGNDEEGISAAPKKLSVTEDIGIPISDDFSQKVFNI